MKNFCLFALLTYSLPVIILISLMLFMLSIKNMGGFIALAILLLGYLFSTLMIIIVDRRKHEKSSKQYKKHSINIENKE